MILLAQRPSWVEQITMFRGLEALVLLSVIVLLVRFVEKTLEALARMAPRSRFFFKTLIPIIRFAIWFAGAVALVHIFAPSKDTLVALTASLGIAVGFGAQDLVKNLIGGVIILTDRPYQLGDRVKFGDAYGEIDHIGLRSTKMTNFEDTRITIPNSDVLTGQIWCSNSGVPDEQGSVDLFLDHRADPYEALEIGYEAAYSSPYLLSSEPVVCLVSDQMQQRPYMRLRIKGYVYDHRFEPQFQSDITARAKVELSRRGLLPRAWDAPENETVKPSTP